MIENLAPARLALSQPILALPQPRPVLDARTAADIVFGARAAPAPLPVT